ncbi:DUF72 domain-containing protein [Pedobacter insulae]|uniref:Uncharacterized conserved protein YecE, DUF72 family n=1 Tax=Pedobacter insulae TaxID=414048 RepID=A0A1I2WID4_9SPHI|nr:DUF72 domain-containing protein [Pedobacter insulae]SFH00479.1 Uncharacterized conserved protein YecE, DUF72 family [Pedobacter insulae]
MDIQFNNYYSGTSGLLLPVPNKLYYPEEFKEKSRLCYYASLMDTIEINSSFYKMPMSSTVHRWAADVPEEFRFTFKLFREITHNKNLAFDPEVISRFFHVINNVEEKKGCLLVQFPPSIKIGDLSQLKFLMSLLRENDVQMEWKIALEFRHPSLYVDEIYELLEHYQFGMVIHDKSPANSPLRETHPDFVYLRFHGPGGNYRGSYSDDILYEYASYITAWLSEDKKVYVYFNNTMGEAHANLNLLRQIVRDTY